VRRLAGESVVRFRFRLIPREERFFEDFVAIASELRRGAALLEDMLRPEHPVWEKAAEIKDVEHRCDQLAHAVLQRLHRTFVTPIDREDIHALLHSLDDVIDDIDASADMLRLYRIEHVRPAARELARMISAGAEQIHRGLAALEAREGVAEIVQEISHIESRADGIYTAAVGQLFDTEPDAIAILKWKEILDMLEGATDRCKDVAKVLEAIHVKHS
jgi:predicted phosphate transport protein (TIGR00153 family)